MTAICMMGLCMFFMPSIWVSILKMHCESVQILDNLFDRDCAGGWHWWGRGVTCSPLGFVELYPSASTLSEYPISSPSNRNFERPNCGIVISSWFQFILVSVLWLEENNPFPTAPERLGRDSAGQTCQIKTAFSSEFMDYLHSEFSLSCSF